MNTAKALTWAMLAAAGLAGCNPSSFNSALDQAPVVVFTPPGASTGSLFVLPLSPASEPGTTSAARMLVSRKDTAYLAVADFDTNGKVTLSEAYSADFGGTPVISAAARPDGTILLGTPSAGGGALPGGRVSTLSLSAAAGGGYDFFIQGGLQGGGAATRMGISVAAGNVTGPAAGDFVVVGDNTVHVVGPDGKTVLGSTSCLAVQLGSDDIYAYRPLAVGDLLLADGLDEIVLGAPGRVLFLQWDPASNSPVCPGPASPTSILTNAGIASFGASLAVADFDGDAHLDLAVGAPQDMVFVYFGPLDDPLHNYFGPPESAPAPVLIRNSTISGFGSSLASYQVPGQKMAQLLVADPHGTADAGRPAAGRALLYAVTPASAVVTAVFFDSNEDADPGKFGEVIGGLMFNTGLCVPGGPVQIVPWASNGVDLLTFFNYPTTTLPAAMDPRCFSLKP
ncbi:MAG: FG-GAP repeat protein [Deltaproteobacteria bacterium]|nr:FG-GAP repeat protein [Deltaproteobacteria bacterium]